MSDEQAITKWAKMERMKKDYMENVILRGEGIDWKTYFEIKDNATSQMKPGEVIQTEYGLVQCTYKGDIQYRQRKVDDETTLEDILGKRLKLIHTKQERGETK